MAKIYKHLGADAARVIDAPDCVRCRFILGERFIRHHAVSQLIDRIEWLMLSPLQTRAWGLVVEGAAGSGKTLFAKAIFKLFPPTSGTSDASPRLPVVNISMTGARTARTIHNRILEALNAPVARDLRIAEREQLAIRLLGEAQARLIILDELQDVLRTTVRERQATLDAIKLLMNTLRIPILGLGIHSVSYVFKEDPHLNARFDHAKLPPWRLDKNFASFLATLESSLPLREPSNLRQRAMMKTVLTLGESNTARIVRLVSNAAVFAVLDGHEMITASLLEKAKSTPPPAACLKPGPECNAT